LVLAPARTWFGVSGRKTGGEEDDGEKKASEERARLLIDKQPRRLRRFAAFGCEAKGVFGKQEV